MNKILKGIALEQLDTYLLEKGLKKSFMEAIHILKEGFDQNYNIKEIFVV